MLKYIRIFLTLLIALLTMTAISNANTFVVDDNGNPSTTYPTLKAAILTANSFPGLKHEIIIMAGTYSDAGLSFAVPGKIASIVGDPLEDKANIVFQALTASYQAVDFF
jgi:hypothetical protein